MGTLCYNRGQQCSIKSNEQNEVYKLQITERKTNGSHCRPYKNTAELTTAVKFKYMNERKHCHM
jgi:hypothetical protein